MGQPLPLPSYQLLYPSSPLMVTIQRTFLFLFLIPFKKDKGPSQSFTRRFRKTASFLHFGETISLSSSRKQLRFYKIVDYQLHAFRTLILKFEKSSFMIVYYYYGLTCFDESIVFIHKFLFYYFFFQIFLLIFVLIVILCLFGKRG